MVYYYFASVVRFAIGMLMQHFLDERFHTKYADMVAAVRSEEKKLDDWTHNKAIQKGVESNRITMEQKAYLKTLKIR